MVQDSRMMMTHTSHFFVNVFSFLRLAFHFAFVVAGNAALCALLLFYNSGHQAFGLIVDFVFFTDVLSRRAEGVAGLQLTIQECVKM
jgi:hypothetical protein